MNYEKKTVKSILCKKNIQIEQVANIQQVAKNNKMVTKYSTETRVSGSCSIHYYHFSIASINTKRRNRSQMTRQKATQHVMFPEIHHFPHQI